jgi:hypothetical protein
VAHHAICSENCDRLVRAEELPKAILRPGNYQWQFPGLVLKLPSARGWSRICSANSLLAHATWIEAEILFAVGKKIAAKSPFFYAVKNAPKFPRGVITSWANYILCD